MSINHPEMIVRVILLLSTATAYNLDVEYPIIHSDPTKNRSTNKTDSCFGCSVLLVPSYYKLKSKLLIGAPKGLATGAVYECPLLGKCSQNPLTPTRYRNDSLYNIFIPWLGMTATIVYEGGWFGASIDSLHPMLQKICAPRTILHLYDPDRGRYFETMQGACYLATKNLDDNRRLIMETDMISDYNFKTKPWYNPLLGFSMHVATEYSPSTKPNFEGKSVRAIQQMLKNTSTIIGNPANGLNGTISLNGDIRGPPVMFSTENDTIQYGYSVSSGCYFGKEKVLFASSAPTWLYTGKVFILNSSATLYNVSGVEVGEYFGASLTSGDLNNDSFDDLIVGAPHWGDDHGKVYAYLGSSAGFMSGIVTIKGEVEGAHFGYSLSSGDLDGDGYADLVVGAPWEGSGVIYVYNGYANLEEENVLKPSQRIEASQISRNLQGFGFSISKPVDVDNNGFPDVAIGAYKSGDAVILRSRPVEKLSYNVSLMIGAIKSRTYQDILVIGLKNIQNKVPSSKYIQKNYTFLVTVDPQLRRFADERISLKIAAPPGDKYDDEFTFILTTSNGTKISTGHTFLGHFLIGFQSEMIIQNYVDPVEMTITTEFTSLSTEKKSSNDPFCKMCSIKYQEQDEKPVKLTAVFERVCREGENCDLDIFTTTLLRGVTANNTWVIGSGDVSLETTLNKGDGKSDDYLIAVEYSVPKTIYLRSLPPFCQEETPGARLMVSCHLGNPFLNGSQTIVKLDLDMKYYQHHIPTKSQERTFSIDVSVKSLAFGGNKSETYVVHLKSNVSASIDGKTNEDRFYLITAEQKVANYSFQHTYNIFKYGPTAIGEGRVTVRVPTTMTGNLGPFILMLKPKLYVSGKYHDCVTRDVPLVDATNSNASLEPVTAELDISKENNINFTIPRRKRDESINDYSVLSISESPSSMNFTDTMNDTILLSEESIVYVNCSTPGVTCGSIVCDITEIKSTDDVGKIVLSLFLNFKKFKDVLEVGKSLRFSTNGLVNITLPLRNRTQVDVMTTFHSIPEPEAEGQLIYWIILTSIIVGLAILAVCVVLLKKRGFFKRYQKTDIGILAVSEQEEEEDDREREDEDKSKTEGHEFDEEF